MPTSRNRRAPMTRKRPPLQPLFLSKLSPPQSSRVLVARERLIERLESAGHAKLTLLSAPAGYGKTTLMVQWHSLLRSQGTLTAWLTLEEADNDPGRFLTYLIAAVQRSVPDVDQAASERLLPNVGHAPTGLLLYLLDRLSGFTDPFALFLDDFGVIQSPEVLTIVQQLLQHLPPGKRLVIALRQAPGFRLERIRAQGELAEIDFRDLQFTREEVEQFLRQSQGLDLDQADVDSLLGLTEGWVAGLQLTTLASHRRGARETADSAHAWSPMRAYDFLFEEVLARQSDEIRSFLLTTSILKRLTGPLCDALTGRNDGFETLEYLERSNMFLLPLDADHRWYRYHGIFASSLRRQLEKGGWNRSVALHQAACEWYAGVGEIQEAAEHAMLAGDREHAAVQMERCAFDLVSNGLTATIVAWGEWLSEDILQRRPILQLAYIYALIVRHQAEKALSVLDRLGHLGELSSSSAPTALDLCNLRALALFAEDKMRECELAATEALEHYEGGDPQRQAKFLPTLLHIVGFLKLTLGRFEEALKYTWLSAQLVERGPGVMMLINRFLEQAIGRTQGRLFEALALGRSALAQAASSPSRYSGGGTAIAALQAEVLYERNELEEAEGLLAPYHPMLQIAIPDVVIVGLRTLARIRLARGDHAGAITYLAELERLGAERGLARLSATARQERVRIALQRGEVAHALQIRKQHDDEPIWASFAGRSMIANDPETPEITRLRVMIAQGHASDALSQLKETLRKANSEGFVHRALLLRILIAKALDSSEGGRQALRVLKEALILAQGEGFVRIFVDEGDSVAKMIREIRKFAVSAALIERGAVSIEYLDRIMHAIGEGIPRTGAVESGDATDGAVLPDRLTGREVDILQRVAKGLSNEDLADQLCISVHTARFHLRNIYSKLGAHNRTQAVALARSLGYLT
jgi:LuxR family transcriptional regulator, maltose regulon positive regulatory protein